MDQNKATEIMSQPDMASAVCYVPFLGFIPAVVFLVINKNKRVKWNAAQSLLTYALYMAIYFVLLPLLKVTVVLLPLALMISGLTWVAFLIVWLVMAARTSQGRDMKLPYLGELTDKFVKK